MSHRKRAFTLTELLVVIGLIVLLVAIAIPAFSIITGGRSIDSTENQLSAILGRARADAIGLQEERGVFFYQETAGGRVAAAIVRARPDVNGSTFPVALDLLPEREHLALPAGVGVQTILNGTLSGPGNNQRSGDGYLGSNNVAQGWSGGMTGYNNPLPVTKTAVSFGGVILFDSRGHLESKQYLFVVSERTPNGNQWTEMGKLLLPPDAIAVPPGGGVPQFISSIKSPSPNCQVSQVGFILFDEPTFVAQNFTDADPVVDGSLAAYGAKGTPEHDEEDWIDGNGVPFLVNRYNGTLMRGE